MRSRGILSCPTSAGCRRLWRTRWVVVPDVSHGLDVVKLILRRGMNTVCLYWKLVVLLECTGSALHDLDVINCWYWSPYLHYSIQLISFINSRSGYCLDNFASEVRATSLFSSPSLLTSMATVIWIMNENRCFASRDLRRPMTLNSRSLQLSNRGSWLRFDLLFRVADGGGGGWRERRDPQRPWRQRHALRLAQRVRPFYRLQQSARHALRSAGCCACCRAVLSLKLVFTHMCVCIYDANHTLVRWGMSISNNRF